MVDIFALRSSGYSYDSTRMVTKDQLELMVKAAQEAPSSYNEQPWNFIIADRVASPDAFNKVLNTLVAQNQEWAQHASALIVVVASLNSRKGEPNKWALYDTGAAALSMALQATLLGLSTHQMGGFRAAQLREEFAIFDDYMPISVMAVGYAAPSQEPRPKNRKALDTNFFWGTWNK